MQNPITTYQPRRKLVLAPLTELHNEGDAFPSEKYGHILRSHRDERTGTLCQRY